MAGFKTVSKVCNFYGFKMGGGSYKEFLFAEPPVAEQEQEKVDLDTRRKDFGTIRVHLYDCIEYPASAKPKRDAVYGMDSDTMLSRVVKHLQLKREDDKKFFYRSISVKEGEVFNVQKKMSDISFYDSSHDSSKSEKDKKPMYSGDL